MQIYHKLLPLATGYFGASSALYPFGGLVVVHGPAGGAWHINIEDEPRWYRGPATVVGAGMLEMDVILGNEDKFIANIAKVATDLGRSFVALAGTPISEIIGSDLKGFARTVAKRTSLPVFMVPTAGSEPYPEGASKAFAALARTFMTEPRVRRANVVNILGAIHLDTGREGHVQPMLAAMEQAGFIPRCLGFDAGIGRDPLAEFQEAPDAGLNVVISASGLDLAEHMFAAFGIPYVLGLPVGLSGWKDLLALLRGEESERIAPVSPAPFTRVLVIGGPVLAYAVKRCLERDFGIPEVDVVSVTPSAGLFKPGPGCIGSLLEAGPRDVCTDSEQVITALMNDPAVDCVVADPCYETLLTRPVRFVPLPHPAMSARIHWHLPYEYACEAGQAYLAEGLRAF